MASNKSHHSGVTRPATPTPIPPAPVQKQQATPQQQQQPQPAPPVNTMNPATANQPPTPQNTPLQPGALTALSQMPDDQLAQLVNASKNVIMPNHLTDKDDPTQKFVYQAGLNEMPQVLDAAAFNQFLAANNIPQRQLLARSVNPITFQAMGTTFNYTAQQVADMMMYSRYNYIGGKVGGQKIGAGTYFDQNGGMSTGYGAHTVVAALNPATARVISMSQLRTEAQKFAATHPKFSRAVGGYVDSSRKWTGNNMSIWALAMGYNVITDGFGYHNVIDRSALVYRK